MSLKLLRLKLCKVLLSDWGVKQHYLKGRAQRKIVIKFLQG